MNLFIDSVSSECFLALYDESKNIKQSIVAKVAMNESSKLVPLIDNFLESYLCSYSDLENISVVVGPGSFTGVRTVCLIVNTLAFRQNVKLTDLSYFDLFDSYPIIKNSSKRDVFLQKSPNASIEILSHSDLHVYIQQEGCEKYSGDFDKFEKNITIQNVTPMYPEIIASIEHKQEKQISPMYIKKPNIQ